MEHKKTPQQRLRQYGEKIRSFLRARGLYLVLMVCLVLVGIAALIAFQPPAEPEAPETDVLVGSSQDEPLSAALHTSPTLSPAATVPDPTPLPDFTAAPATPMPAPGKASPPVKGEIIWPFAVDELIYSETLKQWMTHAGVDVAAKKGDEVYAVFGGTVEEIFSDDAFGVTVVLAHSGERSTVYANLMEEPPLKVGQRLNAGDLVGYVGDTALAECGMKSHLHFELLIKGEAADPESHIRFLKPAV